MATAAVETLPVVWDYHIPAAPLSEFVRLFWYWRGHDVPYAKERILPMGTSELVINLGRGDLNAAGISGPQSEAFIIERTVQDELLGIHFDFGGPFPFLSFPCRELHGLHVSLADVWERRDVAELISRLHDAVTVVMKFRVLERWLLAVASRPLRPHPAVRFAIDEFKKDPGLLSSAAMAERVGFSQRHFIQLFRDEVGLTPKLFCRVQRFQKVITSIEGTNDVDWIDVALSCGYFDQSHFNHDFREFSGLSPSEYLPLRTAHHSHVQVKD
jgi:AraC-like DNA-binding protein